MTATGTSRSRPDTLPALRSQSRWRAVQAGFAYAGALAMTPYLLVKVAWVAGALLGLLPPDSDFGLAGWVVLNTATIAMAAGGIAVALALVRPWGERIPAVVVLSGAWLGCGFLVPMLPYMVLTSLLPGRSASEDGATAMPGWEGWVIEASFLGLGLGLAGALPLYLRRRWPFAFTGKLGDGMLPRRGRRSGHDALATFAVLAAVAVGCLTLYWAVGGAVGLRNLAVRELQWRLLAGNQGLWAFAGAMGVLSLSRARPAAWPRWISMTVTWLASGFLFAWSFWKLPMTAHQALASTPATVWPEHLWVAAVQHVLSAAAGTAMLIVVVRNYRDRV